MLTRAQLRWNYRAIYPDVYVPRDVEPDLATRARGAWLWSRRRGIITGRAAAALHGARWVDDDAPVEILWSNNYSPKGVITRRDRIAPGEITWIKGMPVATPARAALDLGRYLPHSQAVAHLDSIGRATGVASADILELAHRYKGTKGVRRCRRAVDLMDADAQSPQETRIRLALIKAGFPRPKLRSRCSTSATIRSRTSIWAGATRRLRSSMTASTTVLIPTNTDGTFCGYAEYWPWAGSTSR